MVERKPKTQPQERGRPAAMKGGRRVNVYLDAETLARARALGNGNLSEGIRRALAGAR